MKTQSVTIEATGEQVGKLAFADGRLKAEGAAASIVESRRRRGVDDADIWAQLNGWSNGYLVFGDVAKAPPKAKPEPKVAVPKAPARKRASGAKGQDDSSVTVPAQVQALRNPFKRKYHRARLGQFATTDESASPVAKVDPRVAAMRSDFADRAARAGTEEGALAAVPAKFSYDIDETSTTYRGKGQLEGPKGVGSAAALEAYQSTDDYDLLNRFSRGLLDGQDAPGTFPPLMSEAQRQHIEGLLSEIDKTLAVSPLADDVVVHRVVESGANLFGKIWGAGEEIGPTDFAKVQEITERRRAGWRPDMTGMRFTDHGYMSTSASSKWPKKYATQWSPSKSDEPVLMRILAPKGTRGVQMSDAGEMEVLLERGLTLEVVEDRGVVDGLRHLDLRVVRADADS